MGVKVKRVVGRAHSMIEKGKKIPLQNLQKYSVEIDNGNFHRRFCSNQLYDQLYDWVVQPPDNIWFCHDRKWTEHQMHPQRTAGCHLYPERWINCKRYREIKVVPQLNHNLLCFTSAMKNGLLKNSSSLSS